MPSLTQAARYAALVMYAWDMCDADLHNLTPKLDARIAADGWKVRGFISGSDDVVKAAEGIRRLWLRASKDKDDRVCYGYLAQNRDGQYAAVIRGTDGAEEWFDNFDFIPKHPNAPLQGMVETGFYNIFDSMLYHPLEGGAALRAADGIAAAVGSAPVVVLGHSLGAALGTFLSAELAARDKAPNVSACLFASPKPGNQDFANYFGSVVNNHVVYNYEEDLVPDVPPEYTAQPNCIELKAADSSASIGSDKRCCHHLICYIALLDVSEYKRVIALPGMTDDDKQCAACVTL